MGVDRRGGPFNMVFSIRNMRAATFSRGPASGSLTTALSSDTLVQYLQKKHNPQKNLILGAG